MSQEILEPDEVDEEAHIIRERIIEEPEDQPENTENLEDHLIKGATIATGGLLTLLILYFIYALIATDSLILTAAGIIIGLTILHGVADKSEK